MLCPMVLEKMECVWNNERKTVLSSMKKHPKGPPGTTAKSEQAARFDHVGGLPRVQEAKISSQSFELRRNNRGLQNILMYWE